MLRLTVLAAALAGCQSAPVGPVTETGELAAGDVTLSSGEYQDTYTVHVGAGQWVHAVMTSSAVDPYVILRLPDQSQAENDDATPGDSTRAEVTFQVPEAGQVELLATSYATGETGAYSLTYEVSDAQPAGTTPTAKSTLPGGTRASTPGDAAPEGASGARATDALPAEEPSDVTGSLRRATAPETH